MPGGDRTGPVGRGPMTGRAAGYCSGYPNPGNINPGYGRGFGRGFGRGRGFWGRSNYPEPYYRPISNREEEKTYLEDMIKSLEEEIKTIQERIQKPFIVRLAMKYGIVSFKPFDGVFYFEKQELNK